MRKVIFVLLCLAVSLTAYSGCSKDKSGDFQTNDPYAPFNIFHLFDNYPALKAAWDSVPGSVGNQKLAEMMKEDIPGTAEFLSILSYLMDQANYPGMQLLDNLKGTLSIVTDDSQRFYNNPANTVKSFYNEDDPSVYVHNFYGFLDEITRDTGGTAPKMGESVIAMTNKILPYLLAKSDADIENTMNDLVTDLQDPTFKSDFLDLVEMAAQAMVFSDYPMYIDTKGTAAAGDDTLVTDYSQMYAHGDIKETDLGNAAKGMQSLLSGMITLMNGETVDRASMYSLIAKMRSVIVDPTVAEKLLWNMSNYFTPGGYVYTTEDNSNATVDTAAKKYCTDSSQLYSDAQIRETLRETLAGAGSLFMRDDQRGSLANNPSLTSPGFPLADLIKNAKKLYIDWDKAQIKESIYDMVRFDTFGRDRKSDSSAYGTSLLEHLLYLGAISGNFGYQWKSNANEVQNQGSNTYSEVQRQNGHGAHTGYLTLNDSLFSIEMQKDSLAGVGTYDIAFDTSVPPKNSPGGKNNVYRSAVQFSTSTADRANHQFSFSANYPAICFASGPSAGDYGVSTGGNRGGSSPALDGYYPYTANGIGTKDLTSWTFSHIIKACWEGEGPYYSTQDAVSLGGGKWQYKRPDGTVYAEVDKSGGAASTWVYTYPMSPGSPGVVAAYDQADPADTTQRWNRYRESWDTDYFLIKTDKSNGGILGPQNSTQYWVPKDVNGDAKADSSSNAECRTYYEIVPEKNADRECASYEEAIFRNYQWVMNEKKMVLVIPMYIYGDLTVLGCNRTMMESAVFQIIEGNGITGLSNARKYRVNGKWAKANTGDTSDVSCSYANTSKVPGDYRLTVLATPTLYMLQALSLIWANSTLAEVDSVKIYDNTLGRGTATPGPVAQNIYPLSRLGFPRSPKVTSGTNYEHYLLGSRNVANNDSGGTDSGFKTTDTTWTKRNSVLPLLIGLLAQMRERSSTSNNALARMMDGLKFLLKPTMYFNYNIGGGGIAQNCWMPRIMGPRANANAAWPSQQYQIPYSRDLMSDWDISGFVSSTSDKTGWSGGAAVQGYYRPEELPTLLSVLIDSDTSPLRANMPQRADGLLSKLVASDDYLGSSGTFPNRPGVTEVPSATSPPLPDATAIFNICTGLEQLTSAMKSAAKAKGTIIDEQQSNGTLGSVKQLNMPEWMFQKRWRPDDNSSYTKCVDLDLDKLLDKVIGSGTTGLCKYHDTDGTYDNVPAVWSDLQSSFTDMNDLMAKFLVQGAPYCVSENLFDIMDNVMRHDPTPAQVKGAQYTLAKMLAYYNGSKWYLQGEDPDFSSLYDLLTLSVPSAIDVLNNYPGNNPNGAVYRSLLSSMQHVMKDGGFVPFILDTVNIGPYSSGDFLSDLNLWLDSRLISGPNTPFYSTMAELLIEMSAVVAQAPTETELYMIYEHFGFQAN